MKGTTLSGLCRLAGISRQGYAQGRRERCRRGREVEGIVEAVRRERLVQPRIGSRKLQWLLAKAGRQVGRDTLIEILRGYDMLVAPKPKKVRSTYYDDSLPVYRNLLYELEPTRPHHAWVSDIT